jgi:nucleolar protein 56
MKALILQTVYGILVIDESDKVVESLYKEIKVNELAKIYISINKEILPDLFVETLKKLADLGYDSFESEDPLMVATITKINGIKGTLTSDIARFKQLRVKLGELLSTEDRQFSPKVIAERTKIISEYLIKDQIAEVSTQHDFHIKQAVDSISDIDKSINFFTSRLREWYGLHFPELTDKMVSDNQKFAEFVLTLGTRDNFTMSNLMAKFEFTEEKAEYFEGKAQRSMGGALSEVDNIIIKKFANKISDLFTFRGELEEYISNTLDEIAPNMKAVIGSAIAGKLIAIAGSLERLAMMSSSTIQVLGAEKALFKALKSGGKTPKYGILFQWHRIRSEKTHIRGKIARMVAGKLGLMAKVDFYKGDFIGEEYREKIYSKIELIKKQYPNPPKRKPRDDAEGSRKNQRDRGSSDSSRKKQKRRGKAESNFKNNDRGGGYPRSNNRRKGSTRKGGNRSSGNRSSGNRSSGNKSSGNKSSGNRDSKNSDTKKN